MMMAADGAAVLVIAWWEQSVGVRLVLRAETLEHGDERAEVLETGDGDAHRRHHLAAEGVVVVVGDAGVLEADDEVVLLDRRRVDARAWRRRAPLARGP